MSPARIRPSLLSARSLLALGALASACGGGGNGTGPNCGPGTHVSGGVCVVDEALAVQNNANHWHCLPQAGTGVTIDKVPDVEFDGNGGAQSGAGALHLSDGSAVVVSWSVGSDVASIVIGTSNAVGVTLYSAISPNSLTNATAFTARQTYSGGTVAITCTLASGSIDTYTGTPRTFIASGQLFGDNYCVDSLGQALALDATNAYWVTTDGYIRTVPLSGGSVQTIASGIPNVCGLAVDASNVYWSQGLFSNANIVAVPKTGGSPTTIVTGGVGITPIVSDGTHLFWATGGKLWTVPIGGGSPTQLTTGLPQPQSSLAIDASYVYYVAGASLDTIMRIPKGGGSATTLGAGALGGAPIAVDATNVYFLDGTGLSKLSLSGGFPVQLVASVGQIGGTGLAPNLELAVDATTVYYVDGGGTIYKVPINPATTPATPTKVLAPPPTEAGGMALTSTQVAFIASDGKVYLADK